MPAVRRLYLPLMLLLAAATPAPLTGEASVYSDVLEGRSTANGETFSQDQATAAHPSLPLGSEARVVNLKNGKRVKVRINDRGPYARGRVLDLSKAAAKRLGMLHQGTAPVVVEPLTAPDPTPARARSARPEGPPPLRSRRN